MGAQYGALALLRGGRPARVVHQPRDEPLVELLRERPADIGARQAFLRAPAQVEDATYGHLYLADRRREVFCAEDRELVTALAAAGVAVENALTLARVDRRGRWAQAGVELGHQVLAADAESLDPWPGLLALVVEVAEADAALVSVRLPRDADSTARPGRGRGAGALGRSPRPRGGIDHHLGARTLRGDRRARHRPRPADPGPDRHGAQMASLLVVPIGGRGAGELPTVLTLVRNHEAEPFDEVDADIVDRFAAQVATTLALARERRRRPPNSATGSATSSAERATTPS